jgi:hypothetical protein
MGKLGTRWKDTSKHWSKRPDSEVIWEGIKKKLAHRKPNSGTFLAGHKNPYKGKRLPWVGHNKPHTEEAKEKMRQNAKLRIGVNNNKWKGDAVGNKALHQWVRRQLGTPKLCEICLTKENRVYHWANRSHTYKRDVNDWMRLCVPCHKKYDLTFIRTSETINP